MDSLAPFSITGSEVHVTDMFKDEKNPDNEMSEHQKDGTGGQTVLPAPLHKSELGLADLAEVGAQTR